MSALVFQSLLSWALLSAAAALALQLAWPLARPRLARLSPRRRLLALRAYAIAPMVAGPVLVALSYLAPTLAWLWPSIDHCHTHPHLHPNLCFLHPPTEGGGALTWGLLLVALAWITARSLSFSWRVWRSMRALRPLLEAARPLAGAEARLLEVSPPLAFTAGLWRPVSAVSEGLIAALSGDELAAVLAHEAAHARARDPLWQLWAQLSLELAFPARPRRQLLSDLSLCTERCRDEEACAAPGQRLEMASALVKMARLGVRPVGAPAPLGVAFFGAPALVTRAEALLEVSAPQASGGAGLRRRHLKQGLIAASAALASPLHHLVEAALGLLAGAR